jgi:hypothetical protein
MVPQNVDAGVTVKANVSVDAGRLESIDEEAELRGLTRSAFTSRDAFEKIEGR